MSSGPTLTGSNCIEATSVKYTNLNLTEADWCTYAGKCKKRQIRRDKFPNGFFSCRYFYDSIIISICILILKIK